MHAAQIIPSTHFTNSGTRQQQPQNKILKDREKIKKKERLRGRPTVREEIQKF